MKNIKKIIILVLAIATLSTVVPHQVEAKTTVKTYHSMRIATRMSKGKYKVSVYWKNHKCNEYVFTRKPKIKFISINRLTYDKLVNRKKSNTLYIEISIGKQINRHGDGKILNARDPYYNYIKYHRFREGDIIRTYCIFNPYNNWEDDIIDRFDEVIR